MISTRSVLAVALLCCVSLPAPARAQDIEIPVKREPKAQPKPAEVEDDSGPPPIEDARDDVYIPGRTEKREREEAARREKERRQDAKVDAKGTPAATEPSKPGEKPAEVKPAGTTSAGDPAKPAETPAPTARQAKPLILPPADAQEKLRQAWTDRVAALGTHSYKTAQDAEKKIIQLREELGYENLFSMATAMSLESEQLMANDSTEALRRAILATELAPALPYAHWTAARAAFADDKMNAGRYVGSAVDALQATAKDPRWRGALVAELFIALVLSVLSAGALSLLLIFCRHARYFFHDFHHLFPRGAWYVQTTAMALSLLALPVAFRLGPIWELLALAGAVWMYMSRAERIVVSAFFALLGVVPLAAAWITDVSTFAGTDAEAVYVAERGGIDPPAVIARLKALSEKGAPPYQALFVLGQRARKHGEVESAVTLLRRAAELKPSSVEVLNELGNALVLQGDLDGARETYQRALDRDPNRPELFLNLARVHARRAEESSEETAAAEISKSQDAIRKAIAIDHRIGAKANATPDLHANKFLSSFSLPPQELEALTTGDLQDAMVEQQLRHRLLGNVPPPLAPVTPAFCAGLLWMSLLFVARVRPSQPCSKCGRPVCPRCDGDLATGSLCGQCVVVFARRAAVDPPMRVAKEIGIRKFQRRRESVVKIASIMLSGAGHVLLGKPTRGVLFLLFTAFAVSQVALRLGLHGATRVPVGSSPGFLVWAPAALAAILLYVVSARRAFAHFKGQGQQSLS